MKSIINKKIIRIAIILFGLVCTFISIFNDYHLLDYKQVIENGLIFIIVLICLHMAFVNIVITIGGIFLGKRLLQEMNNGINLDFLIIGLIQLLKYLIFYNIFQI